MGKMPHYTNRLLYELSNDFRVKKKDLSRQLRLSPQLIGYAIRRLSRKNIIKSYDVIIDPASFGMLNVMVLLVYTNFEKEKQREIAAYLKDNEYVTFIEKLSHQADLLIEYTVPNLSFFNKQHMLFMQVFGSNIRVVDIYPVIVKHTFAKRYLNKRSKLVYKAILSGDRPYIDLKKNDKKVLAELIQNPIQTNISLAKRTGLNIRTVVRILKELMEKVVIKRYSITLNYAKLGISGCNVLINFHDMTPLKIDQVVEYASMVPEIVSIVKLIGHYAVVIRIESIGSYNQILNNLREEFKFHDYAVYDIDEVLKNKYIPDYVVRD